ncbi:tetratricopeptide repeat protein [uncultured Cyclobacterium sp.]|uniref:tetratricopeptide repeat protein n=1 Tax=uncultured Cyclobacterium sp. TaxID=453820 RepID=UPI0030EF336F|tara:strand:+ start:116546 stop:117268 length:723 start_codon:yes stop_codon:yes gene_type:complete
MATQKTKKGSPAPHTSNELLENPEAIADRLGRGETFLKENTKLVGGIIGFGILLIVGIVGFQIHKANQNKTAQGEMFQAVYYFEQDSVDFALNGDGVEPGFLEIIDEYGGTDAANLSNFYVGSIYLSKGEFQSAVDHLTNFSSSDFLVQAHAYALTGDAYLELGELDNAISYYKDAAGYKSNEFFTPKYLSKLAIAYEEAGEINQAIATYEEIENKYADAYEFSEARKQKARLEGLASSN